MEFDELWTTLQRPVFSLCLRLAGNRADAEDVFQEVWLAIHAGLPRFRGEAQPSTWIYRIALRIGLRARARVRKHPAAEMPVVPDPRPNADELLTQAERDRAVAVALTRLSTEHQTILSLFAVDELAHKEIAAILGIAEGTAWSRLHAARKALAAELASSRR